MKLGFVMTNDKTSYVVREDLICLFSVAKKALNKQRIKTFVPLSEIAGRILPAAAAAAAAAYSTICIIF